MRTEQRDATREQIVKAALVEISEVGFDGVSTRAIAARAGVSQGLLSYHFKSKDALWRATADYMFSLADQSITALHASSVFADPKEQCRAFIRQMVAFSSEHPEFVWFMMEQGKEDSERSRWLADTYIKPMFQGFTKLPWGANAVNLPHLFYLIAGASGIVFSASHECKRVTGKDPRSKAFIKRHSDYLVSLLVPD